jgi:WD40 repeat protein
VKCTLIYLTLKLQPESHFTNSRQQRASVMKISRGEQNFFLPLIPPSSASLFLDYSTANEEALSQKMSSLYKHTTSTTSTIGQTAGDIQLANGPDDSISDLSWSPASKHLAVASWDGKVGIYDITGKGSGQGKAIFEFNGPAFSCNWSKV